MTLSDDGNRAYIADVGGNMLILDVSQIQARKPNPQAREISRLTWHAASIPQNAIPFTDHGHPYVLEFDEYTQGTTGVGDANMVGAARIIDIADEKAPRVVANLRLQVNQPADHKAASADPWRRQPGAGLRGALLQPLEPGRPDGRGVLVHRLRPARVRHQRPLHPKEIAYYVAPTQPRAENEFMASDFAMSKPVIVPARREVWYTDGATGFYALRVAESAWPAGSGASAGGGRKGCLAVGRRVRRSGIGQVRLGMTRKALAPQVPAPRHKTKRAWRWCVRGGGKLTAAFSKRGRVALVSTTARVPLKRARPARLQASAEARPRRRAPVPRLAPAVHRAAREGARRLDRELAHDQAARAAAALPARGQLGVAPLERRARLVRRPGAELDLERLDAVELRPVPLLGAEHAPLGGEQGAVGLLDLGHAVLDPEALADRLLEVLLGHLERRAELAAVLDRVRHVAEVGLGGVVHQRGEDVLDVPPRSSTSSDTITECWATE
jgi:hypothetical protein